ncbi:MAG: Gx transporter family protein [Acetatifactor sp.]|nr:Gx transporter family protein [Acetatifactor sp.]
MRTRRLTTLALFATLALAIYSLDSLLPPIVPIPGIKLGLANIVTLLVLHLYRIRDAALVLLVRILLSALLFGQALSLLYSICGGLLCFVTMALASRLLHRRFPELTSILGGIFHNAGQLLIALLITGVPAVLACLPYLLISGIVTGLFTGLCARFALRYLRRLAAAHTTAP